VRHDQYSTIPREGRLRFAFQFLCTVIVLGIPVAAAADVFGFGVPAPMTRDEPIESWTVFRDDDVVRFWLCAAGAAECSRATGDADVSEKRAVSYRTWLTELARHYQLDGNVLLNASANAKRLEATRAALEAILREDSDATDAERDEAQSKLTALTSKGGYEDRFQQARRLAAAIEGEATPLTLEASDRRAFRVRWPFNFDFASVVETRERVSASDVLTGLEWLVLRSNPQRWDGARAACRALGARPPSAAEAREAAPWLSVSPLAKAIDIRNSALVGSNAPTFWLDASFGPLRVDVRPSNGGQVQAIVESASGTKAYHYWEGRFDFFELRAEGTARSFSPNHKVRPAIVSEKFGSRYVVIRDVVRDPSAEEVLQQTVGHTPTLSVLCVRRRGAGPETR
jgi:hypothetical protein